MLRALVATFLLISGMAAQAATRASAPPPIGHVFIIVLENEPFPVTFGAQSLAPYLAHTLTAQGALLTQYYGIGHYSLDNYIALVSGQAPNLDTQGDCPVLTEFKATAAHLDANGQLPGIGCVYPAQVHTIADQLDRAGLGWKGYMEGMGSDPAREAAACGHAAIGSKDATNHESLDDRYADKHNPFVYFHSIIDRADYCAEHVVPLDALRADLRTLAGTPAYSFITPDLCHDGHDAPCLNGEPGGLISADAFLREWVPRITASPAFRKDGVLLITFDEGTDAAACCDEQPGPNGPQPGQFGPGGGRTGAVMLSRFIAPGTVSSQPYNHYSTLRSVQQWFGLTPYLGYANQHGLKVFGSDVFKRSAAGLHTR
jgi:hypothetical protein